ncbi:uncharacterized protein HKW66_Vig0116380 [Vigna angularis]|uniref:Uncharacterized protein n=1 Tax=Phaseolus angularis TaxID=3914 RepID=A0A8T0KYC0_PHAAN|nr:uncharacterized protein HKW66_Vig0116380 [Vigna angularis]
MVQCTERTIGMGLLLRERAEPKRLLLPSSPALLDSNTMAGVPSKYPETTTTVNAEMQLGKMGTYCFGVEFGDRNTCFNGAIVFGYLEHLINVY